MPGLAKTLLVRTLAEMLDLSFKRIQFTPDLMPTDITGTEVLQDDTGGHAQLTLRPRAGLRATSCSPTKSTARRPRRRPRCSRRCRNTRSPPAARRTRSPEPFFVLATQNPIEQEGTYPLPEAQLDRFMFNIVVDYLSEDDEVKVVTRHDRREQAKPERVLSGADILRSSSRSCGTSRFRTTSRATPCGWSTPRGRRGQDAQDFVKQWVKWGAGFRASQALVLAAKARALIAGRFHVSVADIRALAPPVLRHRIITTFYADSEQVTPDTVIAQLLEVVPPPKSGF